MDFDRSWLRKSKLYSGFFPIWIAFWNKVSKVSDTLCQRCNLVDVINCYKKIEISKNSSFISWRLGIKLVTIDTPVCRPTCEEMLYFFWSDLVALIFYCRPRLLLWLSFTIIVFRQACIFRQYTPQEPNPHPVFTNPEPKMGGKSRRWREGPGWSGTGLRPRSRETLSSFVLPLPVASIPEHGWCRVLRLHAKGWLWRPHNEANHCTWKDG